MKLSDEGKILIKVDNFDINPSALLQKLECSILSGFKC
ncbi:Uncharacterised protein [Legionella busanensis]|uniref:Uncharacterized protein n=1 Tax=Legionella busanensis TaxID=190655 RepID=A0A378KDY7_9GAMM|nr:Uncharacterised protein [Legionella busanensis]